MNERRQQENELIEATAAYQRASEAWRTARPEHRTLCRLLKDRTDPESHAVRLAAVAAGSSPNELGELQRLRNQATGLVEKAKLHGERLKAANIAQTKWTALLAAFDNAATLNQREDAEAALRGFEPEYRTAQADELAARSAAECVATAKAAGLI